MHIEADGPDVIPRAELDTRQWMVDSPTLEHQNGKFHFGKRKSWKIVGWFPDEYRLPPARPSPAQPSPQPTWSTHDWKCSSLGVGGYNYAVILPPASLSLNRKLHWNNIPIINICLDYAGFSRLHLVNIKPKVGRPPAKNG